METRQEKRKNDNKANRNGCNSTYWLTLVDRSQYARLQANIEWSREKNMQEKK